MSKSAGDRPVRLAVPLVKYGDSLVEDIEGYETEDEIALTPEFEAGLRKDFIQSVKDVQIQGQSFRAKVFESADENGPRYVITNFDRIPLSARTGDERDDEQVEMPLINDLWSEALRRQFFDGYLDSLYDSVSTCESHIPTGIISLKSRFVPPKFAVIESTASETSPTDPSSSVSWTWEDLQRVSRCVILGSPGAGKTSLLRRLALDHSSQEAQQHYLPIYIQLRKLTRSDNEMESISAAATRAFKFAVNQTLDDVASSDRIMLLLDGLDEIPPYNRDKVVDELQAICQNHPRMGVFITCRSQSYSGGLESFQHLAIRPFDDSQIEQWVYNNLSEDDTRIFLKNMLAEPTVHSAARWPLLLTIAVDLFKNYGTLSRSRSFLYQSCIEVLADEWDRIRGVKRFNFTPPAPEKVVRTLCQTAYRMMLHDKSYFTVDDFARWNVEKLEVSDREFLEFIRESTGLLSCDNSVEWRFMHRSFQEYLAAERLVRSTGESGQLLSEKMTDDTWREVWQFASERTVDASDLFRRALSEAGTSELDVLVMLVATLLRDASVTRDIEESVAERAADFMLTELGDIAKRPDLKLEASESQLHLEIKLATNDSGRPRRLTALNRLLQTIYLNRSDRFVALIFRNMRGKGSVVVEELAQGIDYNGQVENKAGVESLHAEISLPAEEPSTLKTSEERN